MDKLSYEHAPIRRRRRRMLVAMLLASSLATVGAGAMSLAVFTDSKASTGAWTTGSIVLNRDQAVLFNPGTIMPGDSGNQDLLVSNGGTADLRYAMSSLSVNSPVAKDLASQLALTVQTGTCAAPSGTIYSGTLALAAIGSTTSGNQAGDRTLAAGTSEHLCFSWSLAKSFSDNTFQGVSTSTTFTFAAEQTANNP